MNDHMIISTLLIGQCTLICAPISTEIIAIIEAFVSNRAAKNKAKELQKF